jgi:hypothetical protein
MLDPAGIPGPAGGVVQRSRKGGLSLDNRYVAVQHNGIDIPPTPEGHPNA